MSQATVHGAPVESVSIVVQPPVVPVRYWNVAEATPEKLSAEFEVTGMVPETESPLPGSVMEPVGFVVSYLNAAVTVGESCPTESVAVAVIV